MQRTDFTQIRFSFLQQIHFWPWMDYHLGKVGTGPGTVTVVEEHRQYYQTKHSKMEMETGCALRHLNYISHFFNISYS